MASTIANCHRDPKKGKAFEAADFMPKFGEPERERRISGESWQAFTAGLKASMKQKEAAA